MIVVHLIEECDGAVTLGVIRVSVVAQVDATTVELSRVVHLLDLLAHGNTSLFYLQDVIDLINEIHAFLCEGISQAQLEFLCVYKGGPVLVESSLIDSKEVCSKDHLIFVEILHFKRIEDIAKRVISDAHPAVKALLESVSHLF